MKNDRGFVIDCDFSREPSYSWSYCEKFCPAFAKCYVQDCFCLNYPSMRYYDGDGGG